jgi:Rod binding domain-containing protein
MINVVNDRKVAPQQATPARAPTLSAPAPEDPKLREAAREFEAVFIQQLLSQMRSANRALSGQPASFSRETYESWQDEETARSIARGGGIGLADSLYRQLVQQQTTQRDR